MVVVLLALYWYVRWWHWFVTAEMRRICRARRNCYGPGSQGRHDAQTFSILSAHWREVSGGVSSALARSRCHTCGSWWQVWVEYALIGSVLICIAVSYIVPSRYERVLLRLAIDTRAARAVRVPVLLVPSKWNASR